VAVGYCRLDSLVFVVSVLGRVPRVTAGCGVMATWQGMLQNGGLERGPRGRTGGHTKFVSGHRRVTDNYGGHSNSTT
jgi:hypothetical protein